MGCSSQLLYAHLSLENQGTACYDHCSGVTPPSAPLRVRNVLGLVLLLSCCDLEVISPLFYGWKIWRHHP